MNSMDISETVKATTTIKWKKKFKGSTLLPEMFEKVRKFAIFILFPDPI